MTDKTERRPGRVLVAAACLAAATAIVAWQPLVAGGVPRAAPERNAQLRRNMSTTRQYTLGARVRPLLFWIGRDNVGEARLGWLNTPSGERGYEMLIGSDPLKAPRKINRWGYIAEFEEPAGVRVLGLMTEADEQSLEEAKAKTGKVPDGSRVFKIIRETVSAGNAESAVQGVALSDQLTLHDVDAVIARLPAPNATKLMQVPAGSDPGFLFAMAALLHDNVERAQRTGKAPTGTRRSYVYANKLYDVVTRSSDLVKQTTIKGRQYNNVIESEFEARARVNGQGASYRIVYGTQGTLREVPLRIVYRPNWWFEAECVLVDGTS